MAKIRDLTTSSTGDQPPITWSAHIPGPRDRLPLQSTPSTRLAASDVLASLRDNLVRSRDEGTLGIYGGHKTMSRVTTIITGPDGKATTVATRRSGCGCLTVLAAVVVLFGPAAWFPLPLAIAAYGALGVITVLGCLGWFLRTTGRTPRPRTPQPPPAPAPPP